MRAVRRAGRVLAVPGPSQARQQAGAQLGPGQAWRGTAGAERGADAGAWSMDGGWEVWGQRTAKRFSTANKRFFLTAQRLPVDFLVSSPYLGAQVHQ